ncbi:hypothetical protein AQI95_35740 [Streptomyces yokosukanensis]|uniref:DUF4097 domain-containing protein n=1 Tax=Streptomyces yokosukanensis TaxID=67386 RepID=A0A101NW14_9ACTN|nr:hypothetical protein AQI95_35740 [Streptomyces yokosukanensis]
MQRPQRRTFTATALAALTASGLSACSTLSQKTFEDDAKVPQKVTSIRLDNRDGGVKVDASADAATISVHRKVDYHGDKPSGTSFHVRDGVLLLSGCGDNCGVDYVVTVPAGLPVTGGTSNGGLALTGVGAVDVHTSNGEIAVTNATGPVKLRTSNGDVDVKGVKGGGIDTQTSNGEVTVRTATPQNIKVRTTSGSLTVTAPPAKYQITANDSNGDKNVAFKNDPSGRYRLDLSTKNGDLTVKSADKSVTG